MKGARKDEALNSGPVKMKVDDQDGLKTRVETLTDILYPQSIKRPTPPNWVHSEIEGRSQAATSTDLRDYDYTTHYYTPITLLLPSTPSKELHRVLPAKTRA
jgi:hypothetical protein